MRWFRMMVSLTLLCVCLCPAVRAQAGKIGDDVFNKLFAQLGSRIFQEREAAQKALTEFATSSRLTGAQISKIQMGSRDLEVRRRTERIFQEFLKNLPPYETILKKAQIQFLKETLGDDGISLYREVKFKFDSAEGTATFVPPPRRRRSGEVYNILAPKWEEVGEALARGNAAEAEKALDRFRGAVQAIEDLDISNLDLRDANGKQLGKKDVLDLIDCAISEIPAFKKALEDGGANPNPGVPDKKAVDKPGMVDLGKSFRLDIEDVIAQGGLDTFSPIEQNALALPPTGFQYVGHLYNLSADDALLVGGTIHVGIEYGDVQLIGNPVIDPLLLQIVRFANGQQFFLPTESNDLNNRMLSAFYQTSSADRGQNQFGEFAIVQPAAVPEPSTIILLIVGILGLAVCAWRRQRQAALTRTS